MNNHQKRGSLIRGIVTLLIVIMVGAYLVFGDIPDYIYWTFIVSINITYLTMEYIIRLRRSRDIYKTSYEALMEITGDLVKTTGEALRYASNTEFLAQFDNAEDLI